MARAQKGQQLRGGSRRLGLAAGPGRAVRGPGQAGRAAQAAARACRASRMTRWRRDGQCTRRCRLSWTPRSRAPASTRRWPTFPGGGCASSCGCSNRTSARASRYSSGYMPARLEAEDQRLAQAHARREERRRQDAARDARRHASRHDIALEMELPGRGRRPGDPAGQAEWPACAASAARGRRGWPSGRTLLALFVYQLHVMHGESRIALLWALVGRWCC